MADFSYENQRLKTFDNNWPHSFISPRILAKIGFYYIGPHDQVQCFFCAVQVSSWEMGDNELTEHLRWSPRCSLLQRCVTSNVPLEPISELNQLLAKSSSSNNVGGIKNIIERRSGSYAETICSMAPCNFPEFSFKLTRKHSFIGWPTSMKQTPQQLCDAGFFYTQKGDRVVCFSCGGGLCNWCEKDDPWEQHALWYGKCEYLLMMKGHAYITEVQAKFDTNQHFRHKRRRVE